MLPGRILWKKQPKIPPIDLLATICFYGLRDCPLGGFCLGFGVRRLEREVEEEMHIVVKKLRGWIEVIVGCMFSGKTEELLRLLRRVEIAQQKSQVFKPALDGRGEVGGVRTISSHSGKCLPATAVEAAREILDLIEEGTAVVAIDEAQFFDPELVFVCEQLAERGLRVIVAGLNRDALDRPFGPVPLLMALAEERLTLLTAICEVCGAPATRSQLLQDGEPVPWTEGDLILVGDHRIGYEARCRNCHKVPGKPGGGKDGD